MAARPLRAWVAALLPVVAYGAAIVAVSSQSELPPSPVGDKLAHFLEYGVLGFLLARALFLLSNRAIGFSAVAAVVLATAFGVTDELHQYFVPNRDASGWDLLADFLGSAVGAFGYLFLAVESARRTAELVRDQAAD